MRKALAQDAGRALSLDRLRAGADLDAFLRGAPIPGARALQAQPATFCVQRHSYAVIAGALSALLLHSARHGVQPARRARRAASRAARAEVANRWRLAALDITDVFSGANRGDYNLSEVIERLGRLPQARSKLSDDPEVRADVLGASYEPGAATSRRARCRAIRTPPPNAHELRMAAPSIPSRWGLAVVSQRLAGLEIEIKVISTVKMLILDDTVRELERAGGHTLTRMG